MKEAEAKLKISEDKVTQSILEISKKYSAVKRVILFGSRARGDFNRNSDYDIAVLCNDQNTRLHFEQDIDQLPILTKIDLIYITENMAGSELLINIEKDGIIIMDKFLHKLDNYSKALSRLHESIEESKSSGSLTLRDGVIQRFEFTTELAWKTAREYLLTLDIINIDSPKFVMREAFANHLIEDADGWGQILADRNITSHIYNDDDADEVYERLVNKHIHLFDELLDKLNAVR